MKIFSLVVLLLQVISAQAADHASASLVRGENANGEIVLGVHFKLDPEWHIYWKNPGDSGAAPKFKIEVTHGALGKPIEWPAPKRIPIGDLTNFGYENEVTFPFTVKPDHGAEKVSVKLDLEWLVCKVECVPGFGKLNGEFKINESPGKPAGWENPAHPFAKSQAALSLSPKATGDGIEFKFDTAKDFEVYPVDGSLFRTSWKNNTLLWAPNANRSLDKTKFLVKYQDATGWHATEGDVFFSTQIPWREIFFAFLSAFIGGMILNLMPCVFPVLSIKIFSLMKESSKPQVLRRNGWLYSLGVVTTFVALALFLLVFRTGGEKLGWGFQLQSPAFVLAMALLFYGMAMNFLGVLHLGEKTANVAGSFFRFQFFDSSFGTGILSTLVATPCTAPFMGTALGASLLFPWWGSLLIFASLGAGMAAPFLFLCYSPKALKLLPRPGKWMERTKEFFAFPLFATTAWLAWVLAQQTGPNGVFVLGLTLVVFSLGAWWKKKIGFALIVLSVVGSLALVSKVGDSQVQKASEWRAFDPKRIQEAQGQGQAVFIDFTAAWCITCQWNKKSVLETGPVEALFKKNNVQLFRADWTDGDPVITETLESYGRNSVPLYVYLPPKGEAKILPELLTRGDIENLFSNK